MDESQGNININSDKLDDCTTETRDENRSPTSGSSSEAYADESRDRKRQRNRKPSTTPRPKRKRKWKPYTELSWDERRVQDDRETRRAYAKRERLSAEGHPIAPYNTTQFLMDDRKTPATGHNNNKQHLLRLSGGWSPAAIAKTTTNYCSVKTTTIINVLAGDTTTKELVVDSPAANDNNSVTATNNDKVQKIVTSDSSKSLTEHVETSTKGSSEQMCQQETPMDGSTATTAAGTASTTGDKPPSSSVDNSQNGEDIQRYIMDDFSHTYADIHAEQLQTMSKADLVEECLKLEKRVDTLERRVKDCRRKHKYDQKSRADVHLLEKISHLQVVNAQLQKDKESMEKPASSMPASDHGASL